MLTVNIVKSSDVDEKEGYKIEVIHDGLPYHLEHVVGYDDLEELVLTEREVWLFFDRLETVVTETEWCRKTQTLQSGS